MVASTQVIGPYPQPRSSNAPVVSGPGSSALRNNTASPRVQPLTR